MQTYTERISITHGDAGDSLYATFFKPAESARGAVLIPPAMGVPQKFYAEFALWLSQRGLLVATFDYRGIGLSAPRSMRSSTVTITDWAEGDCATMIATLKERLPNRPLFVVGHSLGGQLIGMIPNRQYIDGVLLIASGSGYWRETSPQSRHLSILLFYFLAPVLTALFGYFPGKPIRAVGNLPRGVIRQWRRWCLNPEYMIGVEGEKVRVDFATLTTPMLSLSFTDDEMMSAKNTNDLHRFYSKASIETKRIAPREASLTRVGHFGFFRKQAAATLWPSAIHWMEQRL